MEDGRVMGAGGWNGNTLFDTVQLYDPVKRSWEEGSPLPKGIGAASLVRDGPDVLLISGGDPSFLKSIFRFTTESGWVELEQTLEHGRSWFSAMAVNEAALSCEVA